MPKPVVIIENWGVVQGISSYSFGYLHSGNRLVGNVFGHAHLSNARTVRTSPIVRVDRNQGLVETLHTTYRLGEVSNEYKLWELQRSTSVAA